MHRRQLVVVVIVLCSVGAVPAVAVPAAGAPPAVAAVQEDCSYPVSVTDATGTEVTVEGEPQQVVTLLPSDAQIMWEIGARGKVTGMPVGPYTSYLEGSGNRTNVLNQDGTVNVEATVGLEPDIVLAANVTPEQTVDQLRQAGITVYVHDQATSIEAIYNQTDRVGRLVGACEGASETVSSMRSEVQRVENAVEGAERPRALYYFYNFTAGSGTFIGDVIETAGAENVAASAGISGFAKISDEVIASQDPQWIVTPGGATVPGRAPFTSTTAVQANQTVTVNENLISQPGPRVVQPLSTLARAFHPEAFPANGTNATNATDGTATTATDGGTTTTEGGDGGSGAFGPGFGVVAALVALAATAVLARRRR